MKLNRSCLFAVLLVLVVVYPIKSDAEGIDEGQTTAILNELRQIRLLLERMHEENMGRSNRAKLPTADLQNMALVLDKDPFKGDAMAPLTLVEFSDYECPFCEKHARETLPTIEREYINTGKVKYVFRDFPIEQIHQYAFKAAEAANCAGEQEKYWEMHDQLFPNQKSLNMGKVQELAAAIGLNLAQFEECLDTGKQEPKIQKDMEDGRKAGVRGTPTFFLGLTEPGSSKFRVLRVLTGAQPFVNFQEAIDVLLAQQK